MKFDLFYFLLGGLKSTVYLVFLTAKYYIIYKLVIYEKNDRLVFKVDFEKTYNNTLN